MGRELGLTYAFQVDRATTAPGAEATDQLAARTTPTPVGD
jgi:hypothetical protein